MKLKNRHTLHTQFSLSSMTDVVFLLLIFFMLRVSLATPTGLTVELPTSQAGDAIAPQTRVTITAALMYYVDDVPTALADLPAILSEKLSTQNGVLLLELDQSVPVANMIQVTDIASRLGASISVATHLVENENA